LDGHWRAEGCIARVSKLGEEIPGNLRNPVIGSGIAAFSLMSSVEGAGLDGVVCIAPFEVVADMVAVLPSRYLGRNVAVVVFSFLQSDPLCAVRAAVVVPRTRRVAHAGRLNGPHWDSFSRKIAMRTRLTGTLALVVAFGTWSLGVKTLPRRVAMGWLTVTAGRAVSAARQGAFPLACGTTVAGSRSSTTGRTGSTTTWSTASAERAIGRGPSGSTTPAFERWRGCSASCDRSVEVWLARFRGSSPTVDPAQSQRRRRRRSSAEAASQSAANAPPLP